MVCSKIMPSVRQLRKQNLRQHQEPQVPGTMQLCENRCLSSVCSSFNDAASRALHEDKLIDEEDLEERVEKIPKKILDETINVFRVKKYFTNSAWKKNADITEKSCKRKQLGLQHLSQGVEEA